jgi:hypothetical protein
VSITLRTANALRPILTLSGVCPDTYSHTYVTPRLYVAKSICSHEWTDHACTYRTLKQTGVCVSPGPHVGCANPNPAHVHAGIPSQNDRENLCSSTVATVERCMVGESIPVLTLNPRRTATRAFRMDGSSDLPRPRSTREGIGATRPAGTHRPHARTRRVRGCARGCGCTGRTPARVGDARPRAREQNRAAPPSWRGHSVRMSYLGD